MIQFGGQEVGVRLWGGLGNRLFMVARAFSLMGRGKTDKALVLFSDSRYPLAGFSKDLSWLGPNVRASVALVTPKFVEDAGIRSSAAKRIRLAAKLMRGTDVPASGGQLTQARYQGRGIPLVSGYFQDFEIINQAVSTGWPQHVPQVVSPSAWFLDTLAQIREQNPIAIHVRLGDYRRASVRYHLGILGAAYYSRALKAIREIEAEEKPVWLFSDDPIRAHQLMEKSGIQVDVRVVPAIVSDPAESLALMASCSGLVLGNSTFSWWAAYWIRQGAIVAAPDPWHRQNQGENLIMDSWIRVPRK